MAGTLHQCPSCGRQHDEADYDIGWYIPCCGGPRVVFVEQDGVVSLEVVPEDCQPVDETILFQLTVDLARGT